MSVASPLEQAMLTLINQERAAAGVAPLKFDNILNDAAEDHSASMLVNNIFSHTGADGSTARERMIDAGYVFSGTNASGENIAYQSERGAPGALDDVQDLHDGLMRSSGHRANILNPNFEEIGIGIEEGLFTDGGATFSAVMVTQNFALTQAVDVPGAPTPTTPTNTPTAPVDQPQTSEDDDTPTAPPQPPTPVAEADDSVTPPAKPVPEITDGDDAGDKTPVQPVADEDEDVLVVDLPAEDTDNPVADDSDPSEGDAPTDDGGTPEEDDTPIVPIVVTDLDTPSDDSPGEGSPASDDGTDGEAQDGSDGNEHNGEDEGPEVPVEEDTETPVAEGDGSSGEDDMPAGEEEDPPAMETEDEAPQPDDDDEFDFTDDTPADDDGGEAGTDAPVWIKTHDDDTYAKVITDFTAHCSADAFAALDTELQLFVLREFECNFDLG